MKLILTFLCLSNCSYLIAQNQNPSDAGNLFRDERAAALATKAERLLPAYPIARADALAAQAEQLLRVGRSDEANRKFIDARWALPAVPPGSLERIAVILGDPRFRHTASANCVAFDPTRSLLASGAADGCVRVWDLGSGRLLYEYKSHGERIQSVAFVTPDRIASTAGKEVHLWNAKTGENVQKLGGQGAMLNCVSVAANGAMVAAAGDDRSVHVWNVETARPEFSLGPMASAIQSVDWSRDGARVAAAAGDGSLAVWDVKSAERKKLGEHKVFDSAVFGVRFTPDGKGLAVVGAKSARIISAPIGRDSGEPSGVVRRAFEGHTNLVAAMDLSPDGRTLATGSRDSTIRLWDVVSGQQLRALLGHADEVKAVAFSRDGKKLASVGEDQSVRIWNLAPVPPEMELAGHTGPIWSVAFSGDGRFAASGGSDRIVRIWNLESGHELAALRGHAMPVTACVFAKSSQKVLTASGDREIKVWDVASGSLLRTISGSEGPILAMALSPDGQTLVTGGADRTVRGWILDNGQPAFAWVGHGAAISAIAIRPDGKQLASASVDGFIKYWDAADGKTIATWRGHDVGGTGSLAFTIDGQFLISGGGDKSVKLWKTDSAMRDPFATIPAHTGPVSALAVHPSGSSFASGGGDAVVKLWDLATRSERQDFRGVGDWTSSIAFSPDGQRIAIASVDGRLRIWRAESNDAATERMSHSRAVTALAVAGQYLVSGSHDRGVIRWNLASPQDSRRIGQHSTGIIALAASNDGTKLLSTSEDRRITLWDVGTLKQIKAYDPFPEKVPALAFCPGDQHFIVWQSRDSSDDDVTSLVLRVNVENGQTEELVAEKGKAARCLSFSSDGTLAAVGGSDGSIRIWQLDAKKKLGDDIAAHVKSVADVAITPNRKFVVSGDDDGAIAVWPIQEKTSEVVVKIEAKVGRLVALSVSHDSMAVAALGADGAVSVFAIDGGRFIQRWPGEKRITSISFTPDNKQLAAGLADGTIFLLNLP